MQEIELYSRLQNPIEAIDRIGEVFAKSGMFGCTRMEQGKVLAMTCLALKTDPITVANTYHLVDMGEKGIRLVMKADAMLAKFHGLGGKSKILSRTPELASVELTSPSQTATFSFSWDEAQKEEFPWSSQRDAKGNRRLKPTWATPRGRMQMLWARVVSDGIRAMAPEINFGMHAPEELDTEAPTASLFTPPAEAPASEPATPLPTAAPMPSPAPANGLKVMVDGQTGKLTAETVNAIAEAIPVALHNAAEAWLIEKKWLQPGQNFGHLSAARAERILKNPAGFVQTLQPATPTPTAA